MTGKMQRDYSKQSNIAEGGIPLQRHLLSPLPCVRQARRRPDMWGHEGCATSSEQEHEVSLGSTFHTQVRRGFEQPNRVKDVLPVAGALV